MHACMLVSSFLRTWKQVLLLNSSCERGPYGFGESYNKMRGLVCLSLQVDVHFCTLMYTVAARMHIYIQS